MLFSWFFLIFFYFILFYFYNSIFLVLFLYKLCSLQRRTSPDFDNEAHAFKPVLGSMLGRIYHNLQNKEENQTRLQKILELWASKDIYDQNTIDALKAEMIGGPPPISFPGLPTTSGSADPAAGKLCLCVCVSLSLCSHCQRHVEPGILYCHVIAWD
jgi:hypothetical protein